MNFLFSVIFFNEHVYLIIHAYIFYIYCFYITILSYIFTFIILSFIHVSSVYLLYFFLPFSRPSCQVDTHIFYCYQPIDLSQPFFIESIFEFYLTDSSVYTYVCTYQNDNFPSVNLRATRLFAVIVYKLLLGYTMYSCLYINIQPYTYNVFRTCVNTNHT